VGDARGAAAGQRRVGCTNNFAGSSHVGDELVQWKGGVLRNVAEADCAELFKQRRLAAAS
jgi:hypothetical protein